MNLKNNEQNNSVTRLRGKLVREYKLARSWSPGRSMLRNKITAMIISKNNKETFSFQILRIYIFPDLTFFLSYLPINILGFLLDSIGFLLNNFGFLLQKFQEYGSPSLCNFLLQKYGLPFRCSKLDNGSGSCLQTSDSRVIVDILISNRNGY